MKLGEILGWTEEVSIKEEKKGLTHEKSPSSNNLLSVLNGVEMELWMSKKGRAGKTALVLCVRGEYYSSYNEAMQHLLKELRQTFHCGGSFKHKEIILQYSKRDEIKNFLENQNLRIILCGG